MTYWHRLYWPRKGRRGTDRNLRRWALVPTMAAASSQRCDVAAELGPVCEGCGERTRRPTWFEMDPFCPACVDDMKGELGDYGVLNPGTVSLAPRETEA